MEIILETEVVTNSGCNKQEGHVQPQHAAELGSFGHMVMALEPRTLFLQPDLVKVTRVVLAFKA